MDGGYCKWQVIEVIAAIIHLRQFTSHLDLQYKTIQHSRRNICHSSLMDWNLKKDCLLRQKNLIR